MSKKVSNKDRNFSVTARIVTLVEVEIDAAHFEEAVEKAKTLTESDFITVNGSSNDSSIRIVMIQKPNAWKTDDWD